MTDKIWKVYQNIYNNTITEHSDDTKNYEIVISNELVDNALFYLKEKSNISIYPAKSYIVAIIYATMINKIYGDDIYEVLNDPDLFLGQDPHYRTYSEDSSTYDQIFSKLKDMDNWLEMGWSPKTVEYFYLECTAEGIEKII